jgi:hypothetical protein
MIYQHDPDNDSVGIRYHLVYSIHRYKWYCHLAKLQVRFLKLVQQVVMRSTLSRFPST